MHAKKSKKINLFIVVAASGTLDRYGNVINMMKKDGLKVSYKAYTIVDGETLTTMPKSTALSIIELSSIFEKIKPDIIFSSVNK